MINTEIFSKALLQRAENKGVRVDQLKLQKLAYYCQGYHLALTDSPAFDGDVKAWAHGPVVPELYQMYRANGQAVISTPEGEDFSAHLTSSVQKVLDWVLDLYGNIGSWTLRNRTHQEAPWRNHFDPVTNNPDNETISHEEMKAFFCSELGNNQDNYLSELLDEMNAEAIEVPDNIQNADQFYAWIMNDS
jgi:uncharacterized phage-associated protein